MKKIIYFIALISFLSSCSSNDDSLGSSFYSKSFITSYLDASNLSVKQVKSGSTYCSVNFVGGVSQESLSQLSEKNNDTNFNRNKRIEGDVAEADSILSIDVKCKEALDANHPAGSSVSDMMTFHWVSANDYVKSGYKNYKPITPFYRKNDAIPDKYQSLISCFSMFIDREGYSYYKDLVCDVKANETKLMAPYTSLELNTIPKAGTYHFTVSIKMSERTLSYGFEMTF
jgi:hypothetical protein